MKTYTHVLFILDRSGSMYGLEEDTIGGFNSLIDKQKQSKEATDVSLVLFDDEIETIYSRIPLEQVQPLTKKEYFVRGATALLDAVGMSLNKVCDRHVLCVIITDGMENASQEYNYAKVEKLIANKKETGWQFLFLGANIDAAKVAGNIGIDPEFASNYCADSKGTKLNYDVLSDTIQLARAGNVPIGKTWKNKIEKDYKKRKKG